MYYVIIVYLLLDHPLCYLGDFTDIMVFNKETNIPRSLL